MEILLTEISIVSELRTDMQEYIHTEMFRDAENEMNRDEKKLENPSRMESTCNG
jgi:hypothetical protein